MYANYYMQMHNALQKQNCKVYLDTTMLILPMQCFIYSFYTQFVSYNSVFKRIRVHLRVTQCAQFTINTIVTVLLMLI